MEILVNGMLHPTQAQNNHRQNKRFRPATSSGRRSFEQFSALPDACSSESVWVQRTASTSTASRAQPANEAQVDPWVRCTSPTICPTSSKPRAPELLVMGFIATLPNYTGCQTIPPEEKKNGELPNFLMVRIKNHAFMLRLCSIPNSQIFHASASRDASKSGGEPVGPREFNKAKLMVVAMICALQWQSARSQRSNAWDTVPGQSQRKPHFSLGGYPLVIKHSYWKSPFIVDFPIKNGDFP